MAGRGNPKGVGRKKGSRNHKTRLLADRAAAAGITPIEVLLGAMREAWDAGDMPSAAKYACDAAPYVHPRLAAVEHSGNKEKPIVVIRDDWTDGLGNRPAEQLAGTPLPN